MTSSWSSSRSPTISHFPVIFIATWTQNMPVFVVLSALPSITVFDKNNLSVQFALERDQSDPLALNIMLTASNGSAVAIHDFVFQAAVPKVKHELTFSIIMCRHLPQHCWNVF